MTFRVWGGINLNLYHQQQHSFLKIVIPFIKPLPQKIYGANWGKRHQYISDRALVPVFDRIRRERKLSISKLKDNYVQGYVYGTGFYFSDNMWDSSLYADEDDPGLVFFEIDKGVDFLVYQKDFFPTKYMTAFPEESSKYTSEQINEIFLNLVMETVTKISDTWYVIRSTKKIFKVHDFSAKNLNLHPAMIKKVHALFSDYGSKGHSLGEFRPKVRDYILDVLMRYKSLYFSRGLSEKAKFALNPKNHLLMYEKMHQELEGLELLSSFKKDMMTNKLILGCTIEGNKKELITQLIKEYMQKNKNLINHKNITLRSLVGSKVLDPNNKLSCVVLDEPTTNSIDLSFTVDPSSFYTEKNRFQDLMRKTSVDGLFETLSAKNPYLSGFLLEHLFHDIKSTVIFRHYDLSSMKFIYNFGPDSLFSFSDLNFHIQPL
jgi:hypothetical protein